MRKTLLTLLALFIVTTVVKSQKDVVFIEYFSYTNSIGNSYTKTFRDKVIEGLIATDRILVKDVDSEASLKSEGARQTQDASSIDEERLITMRNLNARYLIQGHLTNLQANKNTDKEGNVTYQGMLTYSLKIIDVTTGTLAGTEVYNHGSALLSFSSADTREKAIANIMGSVKKDIEKFVDKHFALEGTILEINTEKKGEATEVYIDLGSNHGIQKGQDLKVFIVRQIAGKTSNKEIGELRAETVEGDEITLCKVRKGGKEIKAAVGEGQTIIIKTVGKKENIFSKSNMVL